MEQTAQPSGKLSKAKDLLSAGKSNVSQKCLFFRLEEVFDPCSCFIQAVEPIIRSNQALIVNPVTKDLLLHVCMMDVRPSISLQCVHAT